MVERGHAKKKNRVLAHTTQPLPWPAPRSLPLPVQLLALVDDPCSHLVTVPCSINSLGAARVFSRQLYFAALASPAPSLFFFSAHTQHKTLARVFQLGFLT